MRQDLDIDELHEALLEQRERLEERLSEQARLVETHETGENPERSETAMRHMGEERRSALMAETRQLLNQVEAALKRMGETSYGYCQRCGDPIAPGRLEAIPHADCCVECRSGLDSGELN